MGIKVNFWNNLDRMWEDKYREDNRRHDNRYNGNNSFNKSNSNNLLHITPWAKTHLNSYE